jgi:hypothetical protein
MGAIMTQYEYEILKYMINEEPLHILISAFSENNKLDALFDALVKLHAAGFISCSSDDQAKVTQLSKRFLELYAAKRIGSSEHLDEYPSTCAEYHFVSTDRGIAQLKEEDKPV